MGIVALAIGTVAVAVGGWWLFRRGSSNDESGAPAPTTIDEHAITNGLKAFKSRDYETALRLLLPQAEAGELRACQALAKMYLGGLGVEKDMQRYRHWIGRCANLGDKGARARLKRLEGRSGNGDSTAR